MPVKINKKGLEKKFKELAKGLSNQELKVLGGFMIKTIRERTRGKGKGVDKPGGRLKTLKSISLPYAIWRATQRRSPEAATGRKSNVTFSGKMLDDLIVKRASQGQLFIGFRTRESEKKAGFQHDQGRKFMFLSRGEITKASDLAKKLILKGV